MMWTLGKFAFGGEEFEQEGHQAAITAITIPAITIIAITDGISVTLDCDKCDSGSGQIKSRVSSVLNWVAAKAKSRLAEVLSC